RARSFVSLSTISSMLGSSGCSPITHVQGSPSSPRRNGLAGSPGFLDRVALFARPLASFSLCSQRRTCSSRILQKRMCRCSSSSSASSWGSMYISRRICCSI
ncbi:unnamed protein product, partial [Ixodes pacificus]